MIDWGWLVVVLISTAPGVVYTKTSDAGLEESLFTRVNCDRPGPPVHVESIDEATFVLRESACVSREAPFLFLLLGRRQALLVDSGTLDGAFLMRLVGQKLADKDLALADLIVAHTHSHLDHRGGDKTFRDAGATVVGSTVGDVRQFWNLEAWPEDIGLLDLGNRRIEVIPIPGHNDNSVAFFDHKSRLLLTGDTVMLGKITVNDLKTFRQSVSRLSRFIDSVQPRLLLGGHLEREGLPLVISPATIDELTTLSEIVSFVRPVAAGTHFTVVYLLPFFAAVGGGLILAILLFIRGRLAAMRRRRSS